MVRFRKKYEQMRQMSLAINTEMREGTATRKHMVVMYNTFCQTVDKIFNILLSLNMEGLD